MDLLLSPKLFWAEDALKMMWYRIRVCYNVIGCRILKVLFLIFILKYFLVFFILVLLSPVLMTNLAVSGPNGWYSCTVLMRALLIASSAVIPPGSSRPEHAAQSWECCLWHLQQELIKSRRHYSSRTGRPGFLLQYCKQMVKLHCEFCITFIKQSVFERTTEAEKCHWQCYMWGS